MQHQIRANALELREFTADLFSWEDEKNSKKTTKQVPIQSSNENPSFPIRGKVETNEKSESEKSEEAKKRREEIAKELKRDGNSISSYYKAWDKFDVVLIHFFLC